MFVVSIKNYADCYSRRKWGQLWTLGSVFTISCVFMLMRPTMLMLNNQQYYYSALVLHRLEEWWATVGLHCSSYFIFVCLTEEIFCLSGNLPPPPLSPATLLLTVFMPTKINGEFCFRFYFCHVYSENMSYTAAGIGQKYGK